ncbi:DUF6461 domain-containing protein [Streptomyces decoyicus]|uniref:DUF6461 domain-containing protein n=1 Tax=Streptomyces decoyicus TaxID=249567 RepID=UPI002E37A158|nr:DUF6461 domain-containing protein [Streptomyces decoyicus]
MNANAHATAADYAWLDEDLPGLTEAYCLTLVRGLTPEEVLRRIGARGELRITGVEELAAPAYDAWDEYDGERMFVGVTSVGDWALMMEYNGYLGVTDEVSVPLSRGTRLVSHFRNVNALDHFDWIEDGDIRVTFEPLFANQRHGSAPDSLVEEMRGAGFDLGDSGDRSYELHTEAAFALAERLTGVRLSTEVLSSATFLCGMAALPPRG